MHQPQPQIGEHVRLQPLVLRDGGLRLQRLRLLDQRADDVRLPPRRHLLGDQPIRLLPLPARAPARDDRLAPGGHLVQHRDVEIAVERQRQRARDRRRRHHQHVRADALLAQGVALLHAEAVLLVHHRQPQALERHALLDQRVRAHGDRRLPIRQHLARRRSLLRLLAPRQQHHMQAERRQQRAHPAIVLLRQDLRRRQQRPLLAIGRAGQQRRGGHHRLAGADVALQQPHHRLRLRADRPGPP